MVKKILTAGAISGLVYAMSALPALAAAPNNQACLGKDFSGYAKGGADFGGFVSGIASATGGVGTEVQSHLAGLVPDSVIPNSCND